MTKKAKNCKNCNFCRYLYHKVAIRYYRNCLSFCTKKETLVLCDGGCEFWQEKPRQERQCDLSAQRFAQAEEDIKFLCEIYKDA